jgi:hypothetical protein
MYSQFQNPFNIVGFKPVDQVRLIENVPSMIIDPFMVVVKVSQGVTEVLYWNLRNFYSSFSYGDLNKDTSDDPFKETKKKCLPESIDHLPMEERLLVRMTNSYFICTPLTIEKRDGPSFADATMNNLIVDNNEILMQLLFGGSPNSSLPPGQELMQVTEYRIGSKTLARKFESYIQIKK